MKKQYLKFSKNRSSKFPKNVMVLMGALTDGTTFTCTPTSGGVKRIWIQAPLDFVFTQDITFDYTAITSAGSNVFIEFQFKAGDADFTEKMNETEGAQSFTSTLTFILNRRTQALRNVIMALAACSACEGLVVIIEEMTGIVWVGGELANQRFKLTTGTQAETGKKLTDKNQETIVLIAETAEKINTFSAGVGSIPV